MSKPPLLENGGFFMRVFQRKVLPPIIFLSILAAAVLISSIFTSVKPVPSVKNASFNNISADGQEITGSNLTAETKVPSIKQNSNTPIPTPSLTQQTNPSLTLADTPINHVLTPTVIPTVTITLAPTNTPIPTSVVSFVNVQIQMPDAILNFSIELKQEMNVCDVLQKAKDEDKIKSLTFDDSYLSAYKSRYVYEINGYKNNWTFTVNGNSPLGCSLSTPKANNMIIWKFN
jgi:hypothetical protein